MYQLFYIDQGQVSLIIIMITFLCLCKGSSYLDLIEKEKLFSKNVF